MLFPLQGWANPDGGALSSEVETLPESLPQVEENIPLEPLPTAPLAEDEQAIKVRIERIEFSGVNSIAVGELEDAVSDALGEEHSFNGLNNLANRVQSIYQEEGYLMAQAYLPEQSLKDGVLLIEVKEGLLGEVNVLAQGRLKPEIAERFVNSLRDKPLHSEALERKLRLLTDLPGNDVRIVFEPSQQEGRADMQLTTTDTDKYSGYIGLDNHGNRFVGGTRVSALLNVNNALGYAEQFSVNAATSGGGYKYLSLAASAPLGGDGLKLRTSVAQTRYELGERFSSLEADGDNDQATLGLVYPIFRSLNKNVYTLLDLNYQAFEDRVGSSNSLSDKDIKSLRFGFEGNRTTQTADVWQWGMYLTAGEVALDNTSVANDSYGVHGDFAKFNAHLSYRRMLSDKWRFNGHSSVQFSADNLDSSQKMQLGGSGAVRAYPSGEALVDNGVLVRVELDYQWRDNLSVGAFVDAAAGREHKFPLATDTSNHKRLSGVGLKADWQLGKQWVLKSSIAWRTERAPTSDSRDLEPRFWLQLVKHF
ncbi:MAG: ShlB/FhaC/HecB family hemolysin secretion/activation protein [Pseudomonadales bacterium]